MFAWAVYKKMSFLMALEEINSGEKSSNIG